MFDLWDSNLADKQTNKKTTNKYTSLADQDQQW